MRIRNFALIGLVAALAGCSTDMDKGLCPDASALVTASTATVFRTPGSTDPTDEKFTVWITGVKTGCDFDKMTHTTDSNIRIMFRARRPPSADAASYSVPYFVAVTQGGNRILTKKLFQAQFAFAPGATSVTFESDVGNTVIKMGRGLKIGSYEILTGFQLTQEQLDYNVKTSHYMP